MRCVYLKINFLKTFVIKNIQLWVDVFEKQENVIYFLVYNEETIKQELQKDVALNNLRINKNFGGFVPLDKSEDVWDIVKNTSLKNWHNAAFMHLTPFFHAASNEIDDFWSIDADVCYVCLPKQRTFEMLLHAENYAKEQGINLFSLDIWQSLTKYSRDDDLWTFGITYVCGNKDVLQKIDNHLTDDDFAKSNKVHVDLYFNYLQKYNIKVRSFYFENLQFILYGDDFFAKPCATGVYRYSEKYITFPILYYCIGATSRGRIPIADNVVKLDIDINRKESAEALASRSMVKSRIVFNESDFADEYLEGKTLFYLKINRMEPYVFRNLQHWINIVESVPNSDYRIVCDREQLKREVLNKNNFKLHPPVFISSICTEALKYISEAVCHPSWERAAWAHMTTFCHAKEHGVKRFWNIDADDTLVCLNPDRVRDLLKKAEEYANIEDIKMFSLDMWRSWFRGNHWSFGITYTNGEVDWLEYMTAHCCDDNFDCPEAGMNLDAYFTYLARRRDIKIDTFYVENLKFIHYWKDFFEFPFANAGMSYWYDGYLHYPLVEHCIGAKEFGKIPIADDIIKLNIDITNEETTRFLSEYAVDDIPLDSEDFKEE